MMFTGFCACVEDAVFRTPPAELPNSPARSLSSVPSVSLLILSRMSASHNRNLDPVICPGLPCFLPLSQAQLLFRLLACVFFQKVEHRLFQKVIDPFVKVNGELLDILQSLDIQTGCEWLPVTHAMFIYGRNKKVNK